MVFDLMCQDIEKMKINLYDLAFYKNGEILYHRFQPSNNCNDCYSVAKAFLVTAVGLLHDDGMIDEKKSLKCYMADLIPKDADPAWQIATVEDAMTHKLGFGEGFLDIDTEDPNSFPSRNFLELVFLHPLACMPGTHRQYSDAAYYLVSRLISCVAGEKADALLSRRLFLPMKVREAAWSRCPMGYPIGATGLYLSAYDMVKLPALYLERGLWDGQRLLSEQWVNKVIGNEYELTTRTENGLIGKGGMYGQMILLSREKGFAAAWHAYCTENEKIQTLIEYFDNLK